MINEIISTILQILVFTLLPFLVYVVVNKSTKGFLGYIGLKKSVKKADSWAILVALLMALPILALTFINLEFREIMTNPNSVTGKIRQMGFGLETVAVILIAAVFKTAFAEEILFRGFIAKGLISLTNFQTGNILQAIIFGLIHTAIFLTISNNPLFLTIIFFFPAIGAYLMVYLNENVANGSIIPGWIAHGLTNIITYSGVGFLV